MNTLSSIRIALRALRVNKLRSALTMLGIIIGVGAVIAMVAMGAGARAQVEQAFASMGTNVLVVMPGSSSSGGARGGFGSQPTLTWEDSRAMQTELSSVRFVAPLLRTNAQVLSAGLALGCPTCHAWVAAEPCTVGGSICTATGDGTRRTRIGSSHSVGLRKRGRAPAGTGTVSLSNPRLSAAAGNLPPVRRSNSAGKVNVTAPSSGNVSSTM